jgi:hypothetical protein
MKLRSMLPFSLLIWVPCAAQVPGLSIPQSIPQLPIPYSPITAERLDDRPVTPPPPPPARPIEGSDHTSTGHNNALTPGMPQSGAAYAPPGGLSCTQPPTAEDLLKAGLFNNDQLLSVPDASARKIPFAHTGIGGVVLVRDSGASLPCMANDKKTLLTYGVGMRTIISIDHYNSVLGTSLDAIAADTTLNHRDTKLNIALMGFFNPQLSRLIPTIANKDFSVENYPAYIDIVDKLFALMTDKGTTLTPTILGSAILLDDSSLASAPAISLALASVADGTSCNDALNGHKTGSVAYDGIKLVYQTIVGRCDGGNPSPKQKEKAAQYLAGARQTKTQASAPSSGKTTPKQPKP